MVQDLPIRVIRGHKCAGSYTHKIYTYDGLYKVEHTYEFNVFFLSNISILKSMKLICVN